MNSFFLALTVLKKHFIWLYILGLVKFHKESDYFIVTNYFI